jgi:hypothetical protein
MVFLAQFHSHNKDGFLSFTDFNQMVLPCCNMKLRAAATQRMNVFNNQTQKGILKVTKRLVQLLIAETCFNLDLEYLKNRLEVTEGGFSTSHTFQLIDIRNYKYLDMEGI